MDNNRYSAIEIEEMLDSMLITVDTREQPNKKYHKRLEGFDRPFERKALNYGDYSCQYIDTNGDIVDFSDHIAIERKYNANELAQCFIGDGRRRFANEFQRAKDAGAKLYVIVENETWESVLLGKYGDSVRFRSKLNPNAMKASILAWQARYGANFQFCEEDTTGPLIADILRYELREYLENAE